MNGIRNPGAPTLEGLFGALARGNSNTQSQLLFHDPHEAIYLDAVERLHASTAVYTAQPVVDDLLSRLNWREDNEVLLDSSCGDGMFLGRALERLLAAGVNRTLLCERIQGWEIHPGACSDARNRVTSILVQHGAAYEEATAIAQRMIINKDFLVEGPTAPVADVITGNPPYLRRSNVPQVLQKQYETVVPAFAQGDLLHSFLERCTRAVRPGGRIGLVTSDRWLSNMSAARLREALGARMSLAHVERLDIDSAFYRPKHRRAGSPPRIHPISIVLDCDKERGRRMSSEPIYPGVDASRYEGLPTLGEFADVRCGPWLGTFGVFVVDAATARGIPEEYLVPAVDTDDVLADGTLGQPKRWAIRTNPNVEPCGAVMDHLKRNMHRMAARGAQQSKPWLPPETFHKMDLSREMLMIPRIATRPKTIRVPAGCLVLNHNLSIVSATAEKLAKVEKALASPIAMQWVADHAPRLENSYYSMTTTYVRKMPLDFS